MQVINYSLMETITFIGTVHSSLKEISDCPLQENEGAPQVSITIAKEYQEALSGLKVGDKILLMTWLHKANRATLMTKPRNNPTSAVTGVFATRSPDRPNPIGIHIVEILAMNGNQIKIDNLEVIDGTPVVDIKTMLNK